MATEIGIIKTLIGSAVATSTDGSQRTLQVGDRVYQDEVISTGAAGAVEVEFADGSVMTLGRSSQAILDLDVYNPQDVAQVPEDADSNVEALQQALLDGADPSQVSDATAAGAGATSGNEGTDIVQVIYEAPEVTPDNGFDTTGITVEFDEAREDDEIFDDVPTAAITTVLLDEDDLGSEEVTTNFNALVAAFQADAETPEFADRAYTQGNDDEAEGDDLDPGALTILSGNLAADFGDDGTGDIVFNAEASQPAGLTSGGLEIEYWVSDDGHSLVGYVRENGGDNAKSEGSGAKIIFTAEITDIDTGEFRVALYGPVDHPDGTTEDNLLVNLGFTISDFDGDTAAGVLRLDIDDDAPVIALGKSSDSDSEFTVVNHDEVSSAGYHNSYGYYIKGDGGIPTTGVVLEDDVHFQDGGFTDPITVTGYSEEEIGFFIIPNGDGNNGSRLDDGEPVTFKFVDNTGTEVPVGTAGAQWQAFADNGATPLTGSGSHVLFDVDGLNSLNKDGQDHVEDNGLIGNQNWEDLQIPDGDGDYNDVNVNVDWTEVTVTGDVVDGVSYGADDPGSIDFSFGNEDIFVDGTLTSNGEDINFEAVDRVGDDGINDTIVGSADGEEVLTIAGILDGDYDINVLGPIDDNNGDATVDIAANVTVTDGDGDSTSAALNIHVNVDTSAVLDVPQNDVF